MNWLSIIAFLSVFTIITPSVAELTCLERQSLTSYLAEEFSEIPVSAGIVDNGFLIEVFYNPKKDRWVIVMTSPDETSCVMATGAKWRMKNPVIPSDDL